MQWIPGMDSPTSHWSKGNTDLLYHEKQFLVSNEVENECEFSWTFPLHFQLQHWAQQNRLLGTDLWEATRDVSKSVGGKVNSCVRRTSQTRSQWKTQTQQMKTHGDIYLCRVVGMARQLCAESGEILNWPHWSLEAVSMPGKGKLEWQAEWQMMAVKGSGVIWVLQPFGFRDQGSDLERNTGKR